jgi:hypothetical protein
MAQGLAASVLVLRTSTEPVRGANRDLAGILTGVCPEPARQLQGGYEMLAAFWLGYLTCLVATGVTWWILDRIGGL